RTCHSTVYQQSGIPERTLLISVTTTRPPPRSSLFPYTTLFRSRAHRLWRCRTCPVAGNESGGCPAWRTGDRGSLSSGRQCRKTSDRKSTRLNSSHLGISYAVFCLKKKK